MSSFLSSLRAPAPSSATDVDHPLPGYDDRQWGGNGSYSSLPYLLREMVKEWRAPADAGYEVRPKIGGARTAITRIDALCARSERGEAEKAQHETA